MSWKKLLPHLVAILGFVLITGIYFSPQLQGKRVEQADITSFKGMAQEAKQWEKETGEYPLWTNSMFSGMPTYQIGFRNKGNLLRHTQKLFQLYISRPMGYFISGMLCMYILMLVLGVRPWIAAISAASYSLMCYNLILFDAGHNNKLLVVFLFPLVTAGVVLAYRKRYLLGGAITALAMGMSILGNHVQMLYYLGLVLGLYVVVKAIEMLRKGEVLDFAKASGVLVIAALLAVGTGLPKLASTWEYMADTMRGEPILTETENTQSASSNTKGLDWEYAMYHSHGWKDIATYLIPGAAGGGSMEEAEWSETLNRDPGWKQVLGMYKGSAPLYHGSLPFTAGPVYLGIVMFFLFVLSFFTTKGNLKWWALGSVILTLLISMGSHMEFFNRILFDYFPMYNKFRSPNSIGTLTPLMITMMAGLALQRFIEEGSNQKKLTKWLLYAGGIAVACTSITYLMGSSGGFSADGDARYVQQGLRAAPLEEARAVLLSRDTLRSLLLILLGTGALFAYIKKYIKATPLLIILTVLALFDVWTVGKRYLDADTFQRKSQVKNAIVQRPVDKQILKDRDPHYRVHDLSINSFNSSSSSYFHKTVGGYHAAKLQRYQDLISHYISQGNTAVLNMLNAKYIINREQQAQRNPGAMGNAWFVEQVKLVESNDAELKALATEDLTKTAVVHRNFTDQLSSQSYASGAVSLTSYAPDKLQYQSESSGKGLLVFSEIWYGPDKGWKAYIDGEETPLLRANYALRALEVPAGKHEIVMAFNPRIISATTPISYVCSILILLGLIFVGYREWRGMGGS